MRIILKFEYLRQIYYCRECTTESTQNNAYFQNSCMKKMPANIYINICAIVVVKALCYKPEGLVFETR
jgi:hypothetical protein